jgi:LPS export ABC transporter protein LptC
MALKFFTILLALFVAEITFLAFKEPKSIKSSNEDKLNHSTIKFTDIQSYMINKDGIQNSIRASKALKFANHDEVYDINISYINRGRKDQISAKKAIHTNGIFYLTQNVFYENNLSISLESEELEYDSRNKIAHSNLPFKFYTQKGNMIGEGFRYDIQNQILKSNKVKFEIEYKEEEL